MGKGLFALGSVLVTSVFLSVSAQAQASIQQCTTLLHQISSALEIKNSKRIVSLERQNLAWCKEFMDREAYENHLDTLTSALIAERDFLEAEGVANRCLQSNPENLSCLARKAEALFGSSKIAQLKIVAEKAARLGAITESDVFAKAILTRLLEKIRANEKAKAVAQRAAIANANIPVGVSGKIACREKGQVGLSITIKGEITAKTAEEVEKLFSAYHAAEQGDHSSCTWATDPDDFSAFGTHFSIDSNGGDIDAAMAIGRLFRKEQAWLQVGGLCQSSCVLILAGAIDRHIAGDNVVGIHRPYFTVNRGNTPAETARAYSRYLAQIKSYLQEMNVSTQLATDMLAIEPDDSRMLTLRELASYRLVGADPTEQERRAVRHEIRDLKEAGRLGIDRIEYTKRRKHARETCAIIAASPLENSHAKYGACVDHIMKTGGN